MSDFVRPGRMGRIMVAAFTATMLVALGTASAAEFAIQKPWDCMCCENWAEHLRRNGHTTTIIGEDPDNMLAIKKLAGIPEELWSCYTATVGGYIIEGHVPEKDIARLLLERPDALGLSVPGMPIGSPGMEIDDELEAFDVILFRKDGTTEVFASYE